MSWPQEIGERPLPALQILQNKKKVYYLFYPNPTIDSAVLEQEVHVKENMSGGTVQTDLISYPIGQYQVLAFAEGVKVRSRLLIKD